MRVAAIAVILFLAVSAFAADVSGKWNAKFNTPDGQSMDLVFTFQVEGEKLAGTVSSAMGEMPLTDGKVDGETLTFTVNAGGFSMVHAATVKGDEMTIKTDMGEMVAKRAAD